MYNSCNSFHINILFYIAYMYAGTRCVAFLDEKHSTIRCSDCELLVHCEFPDQTPCCGRCRHYRGTLRALVSRSGKQRADDGTNPSSHTPFCYLNTPQKAKRYQREHGLRRFCEQRIIRLSQRLEVAAEERGFTEDCTLSNDLSEIILQNTKSMRDVHPSGSFARIFWDSQTRASSLNDPRQMRWDPIMVRWCLYLRHLSSSAYEVVRESGAIRLPSQRTPRDYTYHTKAGTGFSNGVDKQLKIAAKLPSCPEREKCVILIFDEIHLREDLSYDKHTGKFVMCCRCIGLL